ncbi:diguanylate cyclase [Pseudomonas sp. 10B238]|jgi:diguanylate cyclase (GGDEF)-like protein|uniref:diguanylate cyclase n=1 Tax=Pseudomonadaceae TaxID=135621 RepID=UPI000617D30F|nr:MULTISPECIES: diguanylate cyclase [Pseudomonadaceae]MAL35439.1 diguanylate cyclase [Pseudomonas sp.]MBU0950039.1 diguanylate cyclase [Gammaproteobacteria bacterium]KJJ62372.1 diguanylate cyclase [Pseudomonas sp. 10B238]MBK3794159.1 diguanylate cyclase [Stutzerimonas stutzeri]MBK3875649.1 diguanylate cyclase [Stutzerimonas stutzeri]|tara:strand:- start:3103 stop:4734 length:1632 start_codon:yes stop_codon:yes gene_type:complete
MNEGANEALQRQLQALNEKFAERLSEELEALEQYAEQLQSVREQEQRRQLMLALLERLHRLAGTAGTFGFTTLGEQSRLLERRAERWLEAAKPSGQALSAFVRAVQQMAATGRAGGAGPHPELHSSTSDALPAGCRIYLLESDFEAGQNMCQTLGNFGYEVLLFPEISLLQSAVQGQLPDALIVSQHDGELAAVSALQQSLEVPLPLQVIGHRADFGSQLAAVRAGAKGFFVRPVDITQLENSLENILNLQLNEPYRVLIIDDDDDLSARYSLVLRNSQMLVRTLSDPSQLFEVMREFDPEMVLLDMNMPDFTGIELAQMIRLNDEWLRVPIIYLSAETDINRQMAALLKAGDDFITKPISDNALTAAVFSRVQRARALSMALSRDSLTGLLKHADIKEQVALEVERAQRSGKPTSVVMLDLDHFKQVNDQYGHAAGDNVIRSLANLMRQRLRRIDSIGRYGGEEFVAVLPDCPAEQAKRIFDEIRLRFAALSFHAGARTFSVSLSAGISETNGHFGAGAMLELADQALYAAKHNGRNQVQTA